MANYTIIGGDKKEYGPVTGEEVRQWITEGRLDGNSLMRSENDTEWRPLSTFPEFTPVLQPRSQTPPPLNPLPVHRPPVDGQQVKTPAVCLMVAAALNALLGLWALVKALFFPDNFDQLMAQMPANPDPQVQKMAASIIHLMTGPGAMVSAVLGLVMSVVVLAGASRMLALRNYEFARIAAIVAVVPCLTPCLGYILFLPFGIWALVVLGKPGVKGHFN